MATKRQFPWTEEFNVVSSDSSSSSSSSSDSDMQTNTRDNWNVSLSSNSMKTDMPVNALISAEALLMRRAETYQEYMKILPVPTLRGSVIPFHSWIELGNSLKKLYGQPLHYFTNILLKQWDQARIGCEDEETPLDNIIHPTKAEATVWLMEEVHRRASSHHAVAKHWLSDPMYNAFIDSMVP